MTSTETLTLLNVKCDYVNVKEFAGIYHVTDTTVWQWIRRGKVRTAKKVGRDGFIPSITKKPKCKRGVHMLAEIQGKISRIGSNLTERLEDNLTGNVFGTLRYLPFSDVLGKILENGVYPQAIAEDIRSINSDFWADKIKFWPYHREGEIDALIEFQDTIIGIEVKYKSGLSSDDDVTNNTERLTNQKEKEIKQSINQLARESRIVSRKGQGKSKLLLFIADRMTCKEVYEDVLNRNIIKKDVKLGYISWQDILIQLKNLHLTAPFQQIIIQDVIALLTRKGFEDFKNMYITSPT